MIYMQSKDELVLGKQSMNEQKAGSEVPEKNLEGFTQIIPPGKRLTSVSTAEARRKLRMEARLVITAGINRGRIVWLDKDEILFGREEGCEVCLNDEAVSRKQCAVKVDNGSFLITDFNSRNGSFVNGLRIREKVLQHGDKIRVGATELVFLENDELPTSTPIEDNVLKLTDGIPHPGSKEFVLESNIANKIAPYPSLKPVPGSDSRAGDSCVDGHEPYGRQRLSVAIYQNHTPAAMETAGVRYGCKPGCRWLSAYRAKGLRSHSTGQNRAPHCGRRGRPGGVSGFVRRRYGPGDRD